ncbi:MULTISPECIES: GNAT family N-acetyltransferase [Nocardia]|uniref:GNAT family N-acetyltransferase n=1 Tax=Nocardia TaxID=1817 RepID=UPI000D695596|nr:MULTISPECIES: GNAT family N-acetyltransferase [Nocardia]
MTTERTIHLETTGHPLDDPVGASLRGAHRRFAERAGRIIRYDPQVAGFIAHPPAPEAEDWADLAGFLGPDGTAGLRGESYALPSDWTVLQELDSLQMDGTALRVAHDPELEVLTADDVPAMLELIARTEPGPFFPRTIEMGVYLGLRIDGRLVAMAGERLRPPGWTEISAVCTLAEFRGRGFASRLIRAVGAGIGERGERPFLHTLASNVTAIRLYESLGFKVRARAKLTIVRPPVPAPGVN